MRRVPIILCAALLSATAMAADAPAPLPPGIVLSSSSFADGGIIPAKYTSDSPTPVSPALSWINTPPGTVSFTLIMHDPDAAPQKKLGGNLHWMAFNIPGTKTSLPEGIDASPQLPDGTIQAKTGSGKVGFAAPGARTAIHHYTFELFALDTKLALGPDATRDDVHKAIDGHILGKGVVVGRFRRQLTQ